MKILMLVLVLGMVSCASVKLKPGAEKVVVSKDSPPSSCKNVGSAESYAEFGLGFKSAQKREGLLRLLRNRAFDNGANYVKLEIETDNRYGGPMFICSP